MAATSLTPYRGVATSHATVMPHLIRSGLEGVHAGSRLLGMFAVRAWTGGVLGRLALAMQMVKMVCIPACGQNLIWAEKK